MVFQCECVYDVISNLCHRPRPHLSICAAVAVVSHACVVCLFAAMDSHLWYSSTKTPQCQFFILCFFFFFCGFMNLNVGYVACMSPDVIVSKTGVSDSLEITDSYHCHAEAASQRMDAFIFKTVL